MKKFISFLLVFVLLFTIVPQFSTVEVDAASSGLTIQQLRQKFPHGKYWNHAGNPGPSASVNNQNGYTSKPCTLHGGYIGTSSQTCNGFQPGSTQLSWQCMGYAEKLGYDATGYNPRNNANGWYTYTSSSALNNLKPGDIVRYKNNGHSIYVIAVNGDTVTYTDCNSDGHCIIRWDATISKSTLRSTFTHVRSAPSAASTGSSSSSCSCSTSYAGTYICTTSSANLTIRSGHGKSYSAIGSIPSGASVTVKKASGTGSGDWAHVEYNGISGYASMEYLKKSGTTLDVRFSYWLSYDKLGSSITSAKEGDWVYLCYRLFDKNTDKNLNQVKSYNYSVKETIYKPDGSIAHTYTYKNDDNSWIGAGCYTPGTYSYKLELTGDWIGTYTGTFTVAANPMKIHSSESSLGLTLGSSETTTLYVWTTGYHGNPTVLNKSASNNNISTKWGEWKDGRMPITITANSAGTTTLTLAVKEKESGKVLHKITVNVTVGAKTYSVAYNANGGTGAPSSQTKYHGTALTLSTVRPTRQGYTFLGWSTDRNASSASYSPGGSYSSNSGATLYAVWKKGCEGNSHSYSYKVTTKPTDTGTGTLTGTCSVCSATTTVSLPKLSTSNYSYSVVKAATCTASGTGRYTWKTTSYGTFSFDVTISKTSHSYTDKVVAPTCSSQGYTLHTCSCGHSYKDNYVNAKDHNYSYREINTPTTSQAGILKGTCSGCGVTMTVTLPKLNTDDYNYTVIKEATCTANGTARYALKDTKYGSMYFDVTIKATGHKYTDKVTAPTCTAQGYTTHTCSCKDSYKDSYKNALGHDFSSGSCKRCGVKDPGYNQNPSAAVISVETQNARPGGTVRVNVLIKNNPGIWGISLDVKYDKSLLTLTGVENGTVFSDSEWTKGILDSDSYTLYFEESTFSDNKTDGVLATLVFTVNGNAHSGDVGEISVSYDPGDIINTSLNDVLPKTVSGGVKIASVSYGDLNGDGAVNVKDSYLLKMYLIGNCPEIEMSAADVYYDGVVNTKDSLQLRRYLAGVIASIGQ